MTIEEWAKNYLKSIGIHYEGEFTVVRIMPWSSVYRINTHKGSIYLKKMAEPFKIEARLIYHLSQHFSKYVPQIIAYDETLLCFLMWDVGLPLREHLKQNYDISLACSALSQYAIIQEHESNDLKTLFQLGVPDWRLKNMPDLYLGLLQHKNILLDDGLSSSELSRLQSLHPVIISLCQELASYRLPESIEHGDFQDNNILLNHEHLIIHDWGDAVVTHPFFSLISFLKSAENNHQLKKESHIYHTLQNAYLKPWITLFGHEPVLKALLVAWRLSYIKFVLNFFRVALCPGMTGLGRYQGTIAESLRKFLSQYDE